MPRVRATTTATLLMITPILFPGCSEPQKNAAPADGGAEAAHVHLAPHGGVLIELGDHAGNLEFLHDPVEGRLDVYVLDGHAENPVRMPDAALDVYLTLPDQPEPVHLSLAAVASALTGETVGDSSHFSTAHPALRERTTLDLHITGFTFRGLLIEAIFFTYPDGH